MNLKLFPGLCVRMKLARMMEISACCIYKANGNMRPAINGFIYCAVCGCWYHVSAFLNGSCQSAVQLGSLQQNSCFAGNCLCVHWTLDDMYIVYWVVSCLIHTPDTHLPSLACKTLLAMVANESDAARSHSMLPLKTFTANCQAFSLDTTHYIHFDEVCCTKTARTVQLFKGLGQLKVGATGLQ